MSKSISLIAAGAPASLMQAAASIVAKATGGAVKTAQAASAASAAVVVGQHPPQGVYAAVIRPPAQPEPAYQGVKTTIVRAVLPRVAADKLQLRDAVDVYQAAGIDSTAESEAAAAAFGKAASLAARVAKEEVKVNRVTLVIKAASKYDRLNDIFTKSATKAIEAAGCTCDVVHTSRATNDLIMFPEKFGVVLTNDDPVCENVQLAYGSAVGGVPATYYTEQGGQISGGHSYKTVALALAQELKALGMSAEASKIEAAAQKDPMNVANAI